MSKANKGERLVYTTPEEVAAAGCMALLSIAEPAASVALSGGSTPKAMYEILKRQRASTKHALQSVEYFFGDERAVSNDHPDSNVRMARDGFMSALSIPESNIHILNGGADNLQEEAKRATADLKGTVMANEEGVPVFDLIFLGMGNDGHTASLFPGTAALDRQDHGFVANDVPQLETKRLTLTYPIINAAKWIVILCTGAGKNSVVKEIFQRGDSAPVYPIEKIEAKRITWLMDAASAEGIQ